jgi:hypothetical protein
MVETPPDAPSLALATGFSRIGAIGDRAEDDDETRLQHRFLVYMGLLMSGGGLMWGTLALVVSGPRESIIPYGYVVLTALNLLFFWRTKRFEIVQAFQVFISLALPFTFQWILGGFLASGAVMLWAMLSLVGSLTFSKARTVVKWLVLYCVLTVLSGFWDAQLVEEASVVFSRDVSTLFFVVNITVISSIVFGLTLYLLVQREAAMNALRTAKQRIDGLEQEVEDARRLGQYTLITKLGEGGMGTVYRASHAMLRRPTAVKLVSADKAGEETLERFEREVQLTAQLTHPNTVTIFDYGRTDDGTFYYAMELLDGADLQTVVDVGGPMPPGRVVHVLQQAAAALSEAHAEGLIHRDIKPANIILSEVGKVPDVVKIVDFGLVKDTDSKHSDVSLTAAGSLAGTPAYMSPESIADPTRVTPRADVYALGCVAYFLLTGNRVFSGKTVMEVCGHHLHSDPEPIADRRGEPVPEELESLIRACLSKKEEGRPDTAELLAALEALDGEWNSWSRAEAVAWWTEHSASLRAGKTDETEPVSATVLERRAAGPTHRLAAH